MFRDQPLQPELASLAEKIRSYLALLKGIDEDSLRSADEEPGKISLPPQVFRLGTKLLATDNARISDVSKAIFCASITSPGTRRPSSTKHHPILGRPASSSS